MTKTVSTSMKAKIAIVAMLALACMLASACASKQDPSTESSNEQESEVVEVETTLEVTEGAIAAADEKELKKNLENAFGVGEFEVQAIETTGDTHHYLVRMRPFGIWYDVYVGERWALYEHKDDERSSSSSSSSSVTQEDPKPAKLNQPPQEATSRETTFDTHRAWPLSNRDKVEPLIGKDAADALLDAVNEVLADYDLEVTDEINVMVSEDDIAVEEGVTEFRAYAIATVNYVVFDCVYDEATGELTATRMP